MGKIKLFNLKGKPSSNTDDATSRDSVMGITTERKDSDIFKAYIPGFLYRPPFGMPRKDNPVLYKQLAKNPYVFSVIKTICDEAASTDWDIKVKDEYQDEGEDYQDKIKEITKFFKNPNGNEQSLQHIFRQVITDILEVDAGVLVKVFNKLGEFKQLFARDGSLFLKNPDIYGYMGDKLDFVSPLPDGFSSVGVDVGGTPTAAHQQIMKQYSLLFKEQAAYFQYGWTAGSLPVPFGKREIVYMMQNPRGDSIYGRSPLEMLSDVILNLVYGVDFNLDFYTNNNIPDGVIQLLGADRQQIKAFRDNWENGFKFTDKLGNKRKRFNKMPLTSTEVKFTPFSLNAKDMEVLAQQEWFTKVLWMVFGATADSMGFTDNSNRATSEEQVKISKRKAIRPILSLIAYHFNTQLMTEFFDGDDFSDIPLEFAFDGYDVDEDKKKHDLYEQKINMGIMTPMMVAKEFGVNIEELKNEKEKQQADLMEQQENEKESEEKKPEEKKPEEKKPEEKKPEEKKIVEKAKSPLSEIESYIDDIGDSLIKAVEFTNEQEVRQY